MAWRVARSLDVLLAQLNALAPLRSKRSDGSIGDTSHQNRSSDHNPWYGPGIVTARDFTHDPQHLHCQSVADRLVDSRDPRIKYIIWNRRIWAPDTGWRGYTGANPHTSHLHLSVVASPLCDDPRPWAGFTGQSVSPPEEEEMARPYQHLQIVKAAGRPDCWVTDGQTRRYLPTQLALERQSWLINQYGGDGRVHEVAPEDFDAGLFGIPINGPGTDPGTDPGTGSGPGLDPGGSGNGNGNETGNGTPDPAEDRLHAPNAE